VVVLKVGWKWFTINPAEGWSDGYLPYRAHLRLSGYGSSPPDGGRESEGAAQ